jgi:hypothetical protein
MTVHPDTATRLDELKERFRLPRGQIIDKLVLAVWSQYQTGTVHCVTGQPCQINRRDVPDIL